MLGAAQTTKIYIIHRCTYPRFVCDSQYWWNTCTCQKISSYLDNKVIWQEKWLAQNHLVIWIIKCTSLAGWALKCRFMSAIIWIILKGKSEPDNQHEILTLQQLCRMIFVFVIIFLDICTKDVASISKRCWFASTVV